MRHQPRGLVSPHDVSIHAPRAGGDEDTWYILAQRREPGFVSIHAPRAGGRRASDRSSPVDPAGFVSIHAPRAGGDGLAISDLLPGFGSSLFQSTPPRAGGDPPGGIVWARMLLRLDFVSIHAPRAGGDHDCTVDQDWSSP